MPCSIADVEDKLLNGKVTSIAMAPAAILEAIGAAGTEKLIDQLRSNLFLSISRLRFRREVTGQSNDLVHSRLNKVFARLPDSQRTDDGTLVK
jgi:hypothetical protein